MDIADEARGRVEFLVDTGAARSVLMPGDADKLGIDVGALPVNPRTYIGAGGFTQSRVVNALFMFDEPGVGTHVYLVPGLSVVEPSKEYEEINVPSFLGRDILNRWEMLYNSNEGRLEFRIISADYRLSIEADAP